LSLRRDWSFARGLKSRLESADGVFEGQAVGFEDLCRGASRVTDDGRQHDGAVDITSAAAPGGGGGSFQNAPHLDRDAERILLSGWGLGACQDAGDDVAFDAFTTDMARVEHRNGVGIVAEGGEQMLERNLWRSGRFRELGAASQRRRKLRRHRDLRNIWCRHAHDIS
jgi:hypothetical protein